MQAEDIKNLAQLCNFGLVRLSKALGTAHLIQDGGVGAAAAKNNEAKVVPVDA
jgi:hypothetical protein